MLGNERRKEPVFHMPALRRFAFGIALAMGVGWVLRQIVGLLGYG